MKITITRSMVNEWMLGQPLPIGTLLSMSIGKYCSFAWDEMYIDGLTYKLPPAVNDWAHNLNEDPIPITFTCKIKF